jgi:hypothetical protein
MDDAFKASENVFTFYTHPAAEHLTYAALDDWRKEAADTKGLTRVHNPPRVTYRTATFLDDPAHGIVHDRAYWVSDIRQRKAAYEDVDLTTLACGGTVPVTQTGNGQGSDPVPWTSDYRKQTGLKALAPRALLQGTLGNVASLTIDAGATCLRDKRFDYDITTDGPATVMLNDGRTLKLTAGGAHKGTLAPARQASCPRARKLRLRLPAHTVKAQVFVNGKRKLTRRGRSLRSITVRRLPQQRFRVKLVTTSRSGARRTRTRRYAGCGTAR